MDDKADDVDGLPLGDFLVSMRDEENTNEKGGAIGKSKSTKVIDNYEDDIIDL